MNATTHQQKSQSVVEPVKLPLIAFEDGQGGLTAHFEAHPENYNESKVGFTLARDGFVDTFREFLNVDAFEPQQRGVAPEPVTVATLTVYPDGIESIEVSGEHLTESGIDRLTESAINTVVR